MIRGKYKLSPEEQAEVSVLIKNVLDALSLDQRHIASLTEYDIAPCHVRETMRMFGWEQDEFDTNGWEGDTWYYFSREDYEYGVTMYYCGYTFSVEMYRSNIDD